MRGINKVILVGNVGTIETRYSQDGKAIVNLSLATSESWKDKNTGEKVEDTEWHRCVIFGKLAEIAEKYVSKGSKLYLEGKLKTRSWEQEGVKRYATEIVVGEMQMLDSRNPVNSEQNATLTGGQGSYKPPQPSLDNFDDDIPF